MDGTNADVAGADNARGGGTLTNSKLIHRSISQPGFASRNPFEVTLPMTSLKQIEANRRNALKSTGPRSEEGKQRSRRNAVRHGLTAETVIEGLEDPEDYKAFEAAVTSDYDAQTAVERELVLRLASLLWRLRRATSIETGLLQIQPGAMACVQRDEADRTRSQMVGYPMRYLVPQLDTSSEERCGGW